MTYQQHRTTVERDVTTPGPHDRIVQAGEVAEQRDTGVYQPSSSTLASRVVIVVFGIVQTLLLARIVLVLLDAQRSNDLVAAILGASQFFVAPFEGVFRADAMTSSGGSVLDIAAITALVALTIVELVILAIVRIPRRTETV